MLYFFHHVQIVMLYDPKHFAIRWVERFFACRNDIQVRIIQYNFSEYMMKRERLQIYPDPNPPLRTANGRGGGLLCARLRATILMR